MKGCKFADDNEVILSANNRAYSANESEPWRNAERRAFLLQEALLKSDKMLLVVLPTLTHSHTYSSHRTTCCPP